MNSYDLIPKNPNTNKDQYVFPPLMNPQQIKPLPFFEKTTQNQENQRFLVQTQNFKKTKDTQVRKARKSRRVSKKIGEYRV